MTNINPQTSVINMHYQKEFMKCSNFVRIDRATKWGNPFSHIRGKGSFYVPTREMAIECYELWIQERPELLQALPELSGKVLGCWCKPKACHGDVLIYLVEQLENDCNE